MVQLSYWVALRGTRTPSRRGHPRGLYATTRMAWPKLDISTVGWHTLAFSSGHRPSGCAAAAEAAAGAEAGEEARDWAAEPAAVSRSHLTG